MKRSKTFLKLGLVATVGLVGGGVALSQGVFAADHAEAPGTQADPAADIADFYLWHTQSGTIVAVITFDALAEAGAAGTYDTGALYTVNLDTDLDNAADVQIHTRFGSNGEDVFGVQVTGLPGVDGAVEGAVDTVHDAGGGAMVYAGPRDDPFFFDLEGYLATLDTGTVSFTAADAFMGTNATAIVLEFDAAAALGDSTQFQGWATTGRLP